MITSTPRPSRTRSRALATSIVFASTLALTAPVGADTLFVAANGTDGAGCGIKAAPCRSVSRAVASARRGDTIVVGPGRYGDLAGDGDFDDPGDEAAEIGSGCNCIIHVTKAVTLVSRDGAGVTILDGSGATADVVLLDAPATVFGKKGKGFTVTGGGNGVRSQSDALTVRGNFAVGNANDGFRLNSTRHTTVADNAARHNGDQGFGCSGMNDSLLVRNVASDNGDRGFTVDNRNLLTNNLASRNGEEGFNAQNGNTFKGNVAVGNLTEGFSVNDSNVFTANVAHANHNGFRLDARNLLTKNAVIANAGVGILVNDDGTVITKTSIFGNGGGVQNVPAVNANCGTLTSDGVALQATQNFWGAPTGPGADPADLACNGIGATTTLDPVASSEIVVRAAAGR